MIGVTTTPLGATLKPYSEYRDSGLPWLGQVPGHWDVLPHRALFEEVKVREHPNEQMLSVTITRGVIKQRDLLAGSSKKDSSKLDKSAYKLVCPGDIAYNKMRAWQGAIGVSDLRGIISPAYVVQRMRGAHNPRYFHHLFRTPGFAKEAESWSYGITSDMWSLRPEHFKAIYSPLPPLEEQAAIVRFLDHALLRLDKAIRAMRKTIALLNEQKQAIIHRAVTRGLPSTGSGQAVSFKDSGIPWLGQIPAHWEIRRAKYLFREIDQRSITGDEELLSVSHITGVTPRSEKNITMFKAESYTGHKVCRPGDLVINTMWAWMAALGVSKHTGIISPAYAVYRPREPRQLTDEYADFLLRTKPYVSNYICRSTGVRASRLRLYPEEFFKIPIIIPPITEQESIIVWLRAETRKIVTATQRIGREIDLLREYRTRLIADVVTGKLDVREAAARLPKMEETPAIEPEFDGIEETDDELVEVKA